jgi:hypothetical protein
MSLRLEKLLPTLEGALHKQFKAEPQAFCSDGTKTVRKASFFRK